MLTQKPQRVGAKRFCVRDLLLQAAEQAIGGQIVALGGKLLSQLVKAVGDKL